MRNFAEGVKQKLADLTSTSLKRNAHASDSNSGGDGGSAQAPPLASQGRDGDGGGTCMPTLADQEGRARQDDCGGWDQEDDGGWLSDWEERRETTRRGSAEQGQLKDAPGP